MGGWGEVIGGPKVWARDLGVAAAIGVAITFLGPFGSYSQPLEQRFVTAMGYGLVGSLVFWPSMRLVRKLGRQLALPEWPVTVAGLAVAAIPVTLTTYLVTGLLNPDRPPSGVVTRYFGVLALILPLGLAGAFFEQRIRRAQPAPPPAGPAPPRLLERLPPPLGKEILALQAEDHYVRVHTAKGSTLLLMRLADAIAELDGLDGLRVHRSWWVAREAVAGAKAEGRRISLTLSNGAVAPVTRDAVPLVRKAGWI